MQSRPTPTADVSSRAAMGDIRQRPWSSELDEFQQGACDQAG
ncbi:hypothetical protein [Kribbella antibiotica]|nr:hypothetical protein [Kribbella antibiotica]